MPVTWDRIGSFAVAILLHVAIGALFFLSQRPEQEIRPPNFAVTTETNFDDSNHENPEASKWEEKTSSVIPTQELVTTTALSEISIPDISDTSGEINLVDMTEELIELGISMTGFGDVANLGAIPTSMRSRCSMAERVKRLREGGGESRAEDAVIDGLEYLKAIQNRDTGSFGHTYKAGLTGLALLAYMGHCETPSSREFGDTVVRSTLYLINRSLKNRAGIISGGSPGIHEVYEHAIATYALAELYTLSKASGNTVPRLESVLKKAVNVIVTSQDSPGGWSYGFTGGEAGSDMSVTCWNIQALKAAYLTGKNFHGVEAALDRAVKIYLPANQDGAGAFKYSPGHTHGKSSLTGAAMLGMHIWNHKHSPAYRNGLIHLSNAYWNPFPDPAGHGLYDEYYNTQLYFLHGGKSWKNYNTDFQPMLLASQSDEGSWIIGKDNPDLRIMNTAWAVLMLEVYYRYLPTTDGIGD